MMKKKPEKSKAELERESKEFLAKNRRELEKGLTNLCKKYDLPFEAPFSEGEAKEIISQARQGEFAALLKAFPNYLSLSETEKVRAKLIIKFNLSPKLSLRDMGKINEAIERKLKGASDSSANPELFKFKR